SFFYFFFQVQDNPKELRVFFYQLGALPSPPPWGWSTGFITTPLTTGRLPSQHLDPALPKLFWFHSQHFPLVRLLLSSFWISNGPPQKVILNVADFPSFAISFRYSTCCSS
ncbi:Photosystem II protein D1, partial [Quillaja saponaria]